MFTKAVMAAGLTWITIFSPANAQDNRTEQICQAVSNVIQAVGSIRDDGADPAMVYQFLLSQGIPKDIAQQVIVLVYTNPTVSGTILAEGFYADCTSEAL